MLELLRPWMLKVESGSNVQNGQVVAHITDYETLQTVISVDELDIASIKEGQTAEITASAFPDDTFTGTVTSVSKKEPLRMVYQALK